MEGINYNLTETVLKIYDVYSITKKEFLSLEKELREKNSNYQLFINRKRKDLLNEFCAHKFAYKIKYKQSHSKDADIQYPLAKKEKIIYTLFGWIFRILTV